MTSDTLPCTALPPVSFCVQSSELAVRDALRRVLGELAPLALDVEEVRSVELVLAEALNNIVEHAYPEPASDQPIDIDCRLGIGGLHVSIRDKGEPMPDGKAPIGMEQSVDVDLMEQPEGGFGWFIIQDLARDVSYCRQGPVNRLDLRIAIAVGRA